MTWGGSRSAGRRVRGSWTNPTNTKAEEEERIHGDALDKRHLDDDHMITKKKYETANIFGIGEITSSGDQEGYLRP